MKISIQIIALILTLSIGAKDANDPLRQIDEMDLTIVPGRNSPRKDSIKVFQKPDRIELTAYKWETYTDENGRIHSEETVLAERIPVSVEMWSELRDFKWCYDAYQRYVFCVLDPIYNFTLYRGNAAERITIYSCDVYHSTGNVSNGVADMPGHIYEYLDFLAKYSIQRHGLRSARLAEPARIQQNASANCAPAPEN